MRKPLLSAEELNLLDEIIAGTSDGGLLQDQYEPRLLWFARVMGVPWQDCPDVVQEVFLVAIREIRSGSFRRDSSLITWLDGILKFKIKNLWRSLTRYRRVFTSFEPENENDERCIQEYAISSPARWDENIDVQGALNRIRGEHRLILLLNEVVGLSLEEISQRLQQPAGTIGRKLAAAKQMFRDELSKSGFRRTSA
jgi:RNA polymerase sigma-70 factor, ECF subfamily